MTPKLINIPKEQLEDLYFNKGYNQPKIGELFGCGQDTISRKFKKFGIFADSRYKCCNGNGHISSKFVICKYIDNYGYFKKYPRYVIEVSSSFLELKDKILNICKIYFIKPYGRIRLIDNKYKRFVVLLRSNLPFSDEYYNNIKNSLEDELNEKIN